MHSTRDMAETMQLLPEDRKRELRIVENELLYHEDTTHHKDSRHHGDAKSRPLPSIFGITDSAAFLLGYLMLSVGANAYMTFKYSGNATYFYLVNCAFSLVGLIGLTMLHPLTMFVYGGYLCASFLFSAAISGGVILFILQSNVCDMMEEIMPGRKVRELCASGPGSFQATAVITVLLELALEVFVMWQLKKMYDYALESPINKPKPKGKLGCISLP